MRTYEEFRKARREDSKRWRARNREKWLADQKKQYNPVQQSARDAVKYALRVGWLSRPSHCELCHVACKPHGHHPDYELRLSVIWVCHACHMRLHRGLVELLNVEQFSSSEVI